MRRDCGRIASGRRESPCRDLQLRGRERKRASERLSGNNEHEIATPIVALLSPFALNIIMYDTNRI